MLDIETPAEYNGVITGMDYHSHKPYASSTFKNNDEIRIPIVQQDIITAPFESALHVSGTLSAKKADNTNADISLVNNAIAFLFEDIRYEINGVEIDRTKNVGVTSTIKNMLSIQSGEQEQLKNACWLGVKNTLKTNKFSFCIPLKLILGFFEDYRKVIVNAKQELILLRSSNDQNAVLAPDARSWSLNITNIYWRIPHITVSDTFKLKLLNMVEADTLVHLPFRTWELHEYPTLPQTTRQSWTIKTSTQLEKPRYVIIAFQKDKKNDITKDASQYDGCKLTNVRLYQNSKYFPYNNIHGDKSIFYDMFAKFPTSYYGKNANTVIDLDTFKDTPLYVIDCSHQNDSIKVGPVDVRLEFEVEEAFPDKTTAYCLIIHDSHFAYTLLTGSVRKMM